MLASHDKTLLKGEYVLEKMRMKNFGSSTVAVDRVVCIFETVSTVLGFIELGRGPNSRGSYPISQESARKVIGVTLESVEPGDVGDVALSGRVHIYVDTVAGNGDLMVLSGTAGIATPYVGASTYTWGSGEVFARALGYIWPGASGPALLLPWRL